MGIKQTNIHRYLEPESTGLIHQTALSFLKRNADPDWLLSQLHSLVLRGDEKTCRQLIELVISQDHTLASRAELYLLQAKICYLRDENVQSADAWVKQALLVDQQSVSACCWVKFLQARQALKEGDHNDAISVLEDLSENQEVGSFARYEMAYHFFWKNIDVSHAMKLLEDVTAEQPGFIKAWACLGFTYNRLKMKAKAQQAFGRCIEIDSNPERLKLYKQQLAC